MKTPHWLWLSAYDLLRSFQSNLQCFDVTYMIEVYLLIVCVVLYQTLSQNLYKWHQFCHLFPVLPRTCGRLNWEPKVADGGPMGKMRTLIFRTLGLRIGLWVRTFPPEIFRKFIPIFPEILSPRKFINTVQTFKITICLHLHFLSAFTAHLCTDSNIKLYDVDIEASACVLSSRYAMLC